MELKCGFGVHYDPRTRRGKQTNDEDAGSARKRQRTQPNDEDAGPSATNGTAKKVVLQPEPVRAATTALIALLMKEEHSDATLRRLLLAMHPDKVKDTQFEEVFNNVTVKINELREQC